MMWVKVGMLRWNMLSRASRARMAEVALVVALLRTARRSGNHEVKALAVGGVGRKETNKVSAAHNVWQRLIHSGGLDAIVGAT